MLDFCYYRRGFWEICFYSTQTNMLMIQTNTKIKNRVKLKFNLIQITFIC